MRNLLLAATAALSFAVPAAAIPAPTTTYKFALTGGGYPATWTLTNDPASYTGDGVNRINFASVSVTNPDTATITVVDRIDFYAPFFDNGGVHILNNSTVYRGFGDQLWTGTGSTIKFKTGTFALTAFGGGANGSLTISAVPEPASWAMLIAGFGLTGAAMRRRRTSLAAA